MQTSLGTQVQVWNSRGKQAISVRAIEVLVYKFIQYSGYTTYNYMSFNH